MRSVDWFHRRGIVGAVHRAVEAFEASGESGWSSLERYWSGLKSGKTSAGLAALVKIDLRRRFESGERPRVLEYLQRYSLLAREADRVISLVYEEFCLLEERGEAPDSSRFCRDYELWRDSIASQLAYHRELSRAIGSESPPVNFPDPGERFDKYRLTSVLGEGGVARVYLATEEELGGRQVAIKVSASFGQEPSILAKLDHRNIVPILTVAQSDSGLRGICMPYRPGPTLETLIRRLGRGLPPRSARAITKALDSDGRSVDESAEQLRAGWADFPIDRTFPEGVAWIGLALSNALAYLHAQGVFHRDIKPANILLAHREGPQLLDFNLAQDPSSAQGATVAQKGGTLPYMAPEQLRAFLDPAGWDSVDESADIYSLGLVLRELVTGRPPEVPITQGSLPREIQSLLDRRELAFESTREINPGVPPSLDSIIGKCLEFHPEDRYLGANELAEDLQRFIDRKPLIHAPNTSKVERAINCIFRNRHAMTLLLLGSIALVTFVSSGRNDESGDRAFLQAESYLESNRREDWTKARTAYKNLHARYPNTARSSIGLALTLTKLGGDDEKHATELFKVSLNQLDAEEALQGFLAKDPNSATLLLNLGIVLSQKHQTDRAIEVLERSVKHDRQPYSALVALGNLHDQNQQGEKAVEYRTRVVRMAQLRRMKASSIHASRLVLLHSLRELLDRKLDADPPRASRGDVEVYLDQMKSNIQSLEEDWANISESLDPTNQEVHLDYFQGCLHAMNGDLKAGGERSILFYRAEQCLQKAERAALASKGLDPHVLTEIREERVKLELRQRSAPAPG